MLFGVLLESLAVALGPAQQARRLHTDTTTAASQTQVAECSINLHDRMLTLPAGTLEADAGGGSRPGRPSRRC